VRATRWDGGGTPEVGSPGADGRVAVHAAGSPPAHLEADSTQSDPQSILDFWFADASGDPARAEARESFWFGSPGETDAVVRQRFGAAIEAAARGELAAWQNAPRSALALVLLLDQFPRNVGRGTARAFAHDAHALVTARAAIAAGHLEHLAPIEQAFLILPFQHSESIEMQRESVRRSEEIRRAAPPSWQPLLAHYADFARQHLALIERFGRFPHRNRALGRDSTPEERAYLAAGGASFGQETR
jgi:uncharacterized protein (DUF924 family)